MSSPLRIVFAGTPDFAAASLTALIEYVVSSGDQVVGVYTQPDRPAGRGQKLVASPVKQLAVEHGIPVYQPVNFKEESDRQLLAELNPDIMIVAAYGLILPKAVLTIPQLGCINVHASLLPRWRGAAPIHRALIAGDSETGITIMQMDEGLDTGDMLLKASCPIEASDTSSTLHDRLALLGGETLVQALEALKSNPLSAEKQNDEFACYAAKLVKQEGELEWTLTAEELARKVRGLSPWPVAYTRAHEGVIRIHEADVILGETYPTPGKIVAVEKQGISVATGQGILRITALQFPGGKRMSVQDALNGKYRDAFKPGQILGEV